MYLLTEWEGRTGKYLARGHMIITVISYELSNQLLRSWANGGFKKNVRRVRSLFFSRLDPDAFFVHTTVMRSHN